MISLGGLFFSEWKLQNSGSGGEGGDGKRLRGVEGRKTVVREKKRERRQGEGRGKAGKRWRGREGEGVGREEGKKEGNSIQTFKKNNQSR